MEVHAPRMSIDGRDEALKRGIMKKGTSHSPPFPFTNSLYLIPSNWYPIFVRNVVSRGESFDFSAGSIM